MINLQWAIAEDNQWYTLEGYNFAAITTKGVYVIWHEGRPGRYVRVGQGSIGERLTAHRHDPAYRFPDLDQVRVNLPGAA